MLENIQTFLMNSNYLHLDTHQRIQTTTASPAQVDIGENNRWGADKSPNEKL